MSEAGTEKEKAPKAEKKPKKREEKSAGTTLATGQAETDPNYVPRFKKRYNEEIRPALMKEFGYTNVMQVPRINKIVLNIGAGEAAADSKKIQAAQNDLTAIAGDAQKRSGIRVPRPPHHHGPATRA